jgi:hypothetical protein
LLIPAGLKAGCQRGSSATEMHALCDATLDMLVATKFALTQLDELESADLAAEDESSL